MPELATREDYRTVWTPPRVVALQERLHHYRPKVVIFYSFSDLAYWRRVVGSDLHLENAPAFYHGWAGETLCVVIKHPAATGVTSAYFEEVGRFIQGQLAQPRQLAHRQ